MYNKLKELLIQLDKLSIDELDNINIKALVILAVNTKNEATSFSKGDLRDILALLGTTISKIAEVSGLSVEEICYIISDSENLINRHRKRKEGE